MPDQLVPPRPSPPRPVNTEDLRKHEASETAALDKGFSSVQAMILGLVARLTWRQVFALLVFTVVVIGAAVTGTLKINSAFGQTVAEQAKPLIDAGVRPVADRVTKLEDRMQRLEEHQAASDRYAQAVEQSAASRFDVMYQTMLDHQPKPQAAELARPTPPPDGGLHP